MLYSACKDTEKKLKLQATTNKIGVVAGLIFQPDALCLRCGMAGKRKPYKGRHTVTGGLSSLPNNALAQLVVGQDTAKEPVLRLKTGSFAV